MTDQTKPTALVGCSWRQLRKYHQPHDWEPQPGMDPVRCPGYWVEVPPEAAHARLSGPQAPDGQPETADGPNGPQTGAGAAATVTITLHAPTADNANTWAQTIADLITAEHGDHMRLNIHITPARKGCCGQHIGHLPTCRTRQGHDGGPTIREAATDDSRWWGGQKAGE